MVTSTQYDPGWVEMKKRKHDLPLEQKGKGVDIGAIFSGSNSSLASSVTYLNVYTVITLQQPLPPDKKTTLAT